MYVKTHKETGKRFVWHTIDIKSPVGTAVINFHGFFTRSNRFIDIGIQGTSENKWTVPEEYKFFVEGYETNLAKASYKTTGHSNYVHKRTEEKTDTWTARLETPYGTIDFKLGVDYSHRRQYIELLLENIPEEVEITVSA